MSETRFTDLTLSDDLLSALAKMGYERPTPVQESAIPMVATGRDLMVQSQTGTGKTAAFGIPIIEALDTSRQGIRALVLCPIRELALQVAEEFGRLGEHKRVRTVAVYGGASLDKQVAEMRFAHAVVGTPGRVLDHLRRRTLSLDGLTTLVLDEADEMLSMGFAQELEQIMRYVPESRQTLLFSATIPEDIKRYARRYMIEPEFLSLIEENVAADDVEHHYYMVSGVGRPRELVQVIEYEEPDSAIIFTNTRQDSELVARYLKRQGYNAEYLNGDLPQKERERIMRRTKDKDLRFLVATDIAARGIDISELSHVINYVLPESPEVYIHRTGRTGRAGAKGTAISLIGPREIGVYYYLKRIYNVALQERTVPTQAEIELRRDERRTEGLIAEILGSVNADALDPDLRAQAMRLLEREEAVEVVQALLTHFRGRGDGSRRPVMGGMLEDVPQPERVAPGSRPQTVAGVADRVAIIQSEFRGLPGRSPKAGSKPRRDPSPILAGEPQRTVEPEDDEPAPGNVREEAPPPEVVRIEDEPTAEEVAPVEAELAEPEPEPESPRRRRERRRRHTETQPLMVASERLEAAPAADEAEALPEPPEPEPEPQPVAASAADEEAPRPTDSGCRLFVNVGRRDGVTEDALRDALAELAGLLPEDLRDVDVRGRHAFVTVEQDFAEDLIDAVNGETLSGKTLRVEISRNA